MELKESTIALPILVTSGSGIVNMLPLEKIDDYFPEEEESNEEEEEQ